MSGGVIPRPAVDPIEVTIRTLLVEDPAVAAIVNGRIYQLILPQGVTLPALRIQLIDEPVNVHLRGADGTRRARVQIDCYVAESAGYMPLGVLADAVDAVMIGRPPRFVASTGLIYWGARRDTRRAVYESLELRTIRMLLDYLAWSAPQP
jgi:hypothetical protein